MMVILVECALCCGLIQESDKDVLICNGDGCHCRIHLSCWNPRMPFTKYYCKGCWRIDFNYKPHDAAGSQLPRNAACYEYDKKLKKHKLYGEQIEYHQYIMMIDTFEYQQPSLRNKSIKFKDAFQWNPFYLSKLQKQIKGTRI